MATYIPLGARYAQGKADTGQINNGNWTVTFDSTILSNLLPVSEVYHIVVQGAASGSTGKVFIDNNQWDIVPACDINSWDPNEPLPLKPGQTLYFYISTSATDNNQPNVTIWLRYDRDIPANLAAGG